MPAIHPTPPREEAKEKITAKRVTGCHSGAGMRGGAGDPNVASRIFKPLYLTGVKPRYAKSSSTTTGYRVADAVTPGALLYRTSRCGVCCHRCRNRRLSRSGFWNEWRWQWQGPGGRWLLRAWVDLVIVGIVI